MLALSGSVTYFDSSFFSAGAAAPSGFSFDSSGIVFIKDGISRLE